VGCDVHRSVASLVRDVDISPKLAECTNGLDMTIYGGPIYRRPKMKRIHGGQFASQFVEQPKDTNTA
jgi:hypothetical protein